MAKARGTLYLYRMLVCSSSKPQLTGESGRVCKPGVCIHRGGHTPGTSPVLLPPSILFLSLSPSPKPPPSLPLTQTPVQQFLVERDALLQEAFANSPLMPGAERLVRHLAACGVPMAVATGSHAAAFKLKVKELCVLACVCGQESARGEAWRRCAAVHCANLTRAHRVFLVFSTYHPSLPCCHKTRPRTLADLQARPAVLAVPPCGYGGHGSQGQARPGDIHQGACSGQLIKSVVT